VSLRYFEDVDGRHWQAWAVRPGAQVSVTQHLNTPTGGVDAEGWLAFQCDETGERRRLRPAPDSWEEAPPSALRAWCEEAQPAPPQKRLIE